MFLKLKPEIAVSFPLTGQAMSYIDIFLSNCEEEAFNFHFKQWDSALKENNENAIFTNFNYMIVFFSKR